MSQFLLEFLQLVDVHSVDIDKIRRTYSTVKNLLCKLFMLLEPEYVER